MLNSRTDERTRSTSTIIAIALSIVFLCVQSSEAIDRTAERIQQRLNEASSYFTQDDYFMGVARIKEACSLLKSSPNSMPESYVSIAARKFDEVNQKIIDATARRDVKSATSKITALQSLVTALSNWEPQNSRWHYEQGVLFEKLSALQSYQYPADLLSAIKEFDAALAMSTNGPYQAKSSKLRAQCQTILDRRNKEIADLRSRVRVRPSRPTNQNSNSNLWFCHNCGQQLVTQYSRCTSCGR